MSKNPFLHRIESRKKGDAGRQSEKRILKSIGAQPQPASGAIQGWKSDGILHRQEQFRIECKSSLTQSLKLEKEWLEKISLEAITYQQIPALIFSFVDGAGKPVMKLNQEWVAIPRSAFERLTG